MADGEHGLDDIAAAVKRAGVVGAGGGGFPTHVKLASPVELVIGNGAECDLLLRKDQELMARWPREVLLGLELVRQATGAARAVLAVKKKHTRVWQALEAALQTVPHPPALVPLGDFYPAGDEFILVHEVTGRIVPEGGLPPDCGVLVQNVETLWNVARAVEDRPVTHKHVSVSGEVAAPGTYLVPLGTPVGALVQLAGGNPPGSVLIEGGAMMGKLTSRSDPVTKTTSAVIALPPDNPAVVQKTLPLSVILYRARSACIQCRMCTDLCPRYLLGHAIEPHRVMRAAAAGARDLAPVGALLCSRCALCQHFACPMGLSPARVTEAVRDGLAGAGVRYQPRRPAPGAHPLARQRRVPSGRLAGRLNLVRYDVAAPHRGEVVPSPVLTLPLRQHAGQASVPVVWVGQEVGAGQVIAQAPPTGLGVPLHAPLDGVVREVTPAAITLEVCP